MSMLCYSVCHEVWLLNEEFLIRTTSHQPLPNDLCRKAEPITHFCNTVVIPGTYLGTVHYKVLLRVE